MVGCVAISQSSIPQRSAYANYRFVGREPHMAEDGFVISAEIIGGSGRLLPKNIDQPQWRSKRSRPLVSPIFAPDLKITPR